MGDLENIVSRILAAQDDAAERIAARVLNANPYHDESGRFASGPGAGGGGGGGAARPAGPSAAELRAASSRAKRDSDNANEEATAVDHLHAASSFRRAARLHEAAGKYNKGERLREKARAHADEADAFMLDSGEAGPPGHPELAERMAKSAAAADRGNIAGQRLGGRTEASRAARMASDEARLASRFPHGRDPEAAHSLAADLHSEAAAAHGNNIAGDDHRLASALHAGVAGMYRAARERDVAAAKAAGLSSSIAEDASQDAAGEATSRSHATAARLHREAATAHDEADEAALANSRDPSTHRAAARAHLDKAIAHDNRRQTRNGVNDA